MARQIGAEPDELDAALYARPVPALGGGAAGGMGGGGLTTPDTPRLERRSTARARAPGSATPAARSSRLLRSIGTRPCRRRDATNAPRAENGHRSRAHDQIRGRSPAHNLAPCC